LVTQAAATRAYFTSGGFTRSIEDRSFVTDGLARVQREALLLTAETGRALRDPKFDESVLDLRRARLGNELRQTATQALNTEMKISLGKVSITLDRYDAMMEERSDAIAPADAVETAEFNAVLADIERQVMSLYDDEEQSFFFALSQSFSSNQNLQFFSLALSALVLVGGGVLAISLRRTFSGHRAEMIESDRVEGDLLDANEQIVMSEKLVAIGQWSGGVAHDLRISNAAYMIGKNLTSDGPFDTNANIKQYLGIIEQQVARSNLIISELMAFAGVGTPELTETQIDDVLERSLKALVKNDGIVLKRQIDSGLHAVMADQKQIQRVFLNLSNNALEAMPGGGQLAITAANVNGHVVIAFSDTGVGISEENIGQIFDPLFTTKTKGTGLGLAVCQEIIQRHQGTISARRNESPAGGSTFEVRLPASGGEVRDEGDTEHDP